MESSTTKPVKVFRAKGISVSVFANKASGNRNVPFYKASLQRTYKDGDDFKTTTSLGRDDLPVANLLIGRAWEFILDSEKNDRKDASEEDAGK